MEGRLGGVDQIDACATAYDEIVLDVGQPAMQVALSFHDERVLVHVMGLRPGTKQVWLSCTLQIPYDQILLTEVAPGGDGEADAEAEPEFSSPYELLT
ncbi:MAG: hypothetical protein HY423_11340 [Candidatus Lambdaproteobacteria bacterium]|nr:hypothetical protein [Candidatus Lambdaproteobacteria bacterium]